MVRGTSARRIGASRHRLGVAVFTAAAFVACGQRAKDARPPPPSLAASGDVIARVGGAPITKDIVVAIARERHVTPREALSLAIRDAVFADEAIDRGLDLSHGRDLDAAMARAFAATFREQAKAQGPITEEEINDKTQAHYYWVARPESWVTVHALVVVPKDADDAKWQEAQKIATRIHDAAAPGVAAQRDTWAATIQQDPLADTFGRAASAIDKGGFDLKLEPLPGLAADAMTVQPEVVLGNTVTSRRDPFDPDFVKGAVALERRGDLSPPVRSAFGWHVILLIDRVPPSMLGLDERRALFADDIYDARAAKITADLFAKLRQESPSETVRNVDALLSLIHVGDDVAEAEQVRP